MTWSTSSDRLLADQRRDALRRLTPARPGAVQPVSELAGARSPGARRLLPATARLGGRTRRRLGWALVHAGLRLAVR